MEKALPGPGLAYALHHKGAVRRCFLPPIGALLALSALPALAQSRLDIQYASGTTTVVGNWYILSGAGFTAIQQNIDQPAQSLDAKR